MRALIPFSAVALALAACGAAPIAPGAPMAPPASTVDILKAADVDWQQLNPARGDASPRAATLWGDRNGTAPTGFLVRFVDGFSSPPHIHNVTYKGVVVQGLVHNADAAAPEFWMPTGAYWTQPKGGAHITAARGETIAFIEIGSGPYLVRPVDQAFDAEEKPINVHPSNFVWLDVAHLGAAAGPRMALLWGDPLNDAPGAVLVEVPAGASARLGSPGPFRAVVIDGQPSVSAAAGEATSVAPGSSFSATGSTTVSCAAGEACLVYVRADGRIDVAGATP